MSKKQFVHPYIPNSEPRVKREMLDAIGMDTSKGSTKRFRIASVIKSVWICPNRSFRIQPSAPCREAVGKKQELQGQHLFPRRRHVEPLRSGGRRNHHGTGRIPDLLRGRRLYRPRQVPDAIRKQFHDRRSHRIRSLLHAYLRLGERHRHRLPHGSAHIRQEGDPRRGQHGSRQADGSRKLLQARDEDYESCLS